MLVSGQGTNLELQILRDGAKKFTRPIARPGYEVKVAGPWLDLGPNKDRVFTAYSSKVMARPIPSAACWKFRWMKSRCVSRRCFRCSGEM